MKNNKAQECYDLIKGYFKDEPKKAIEWFHAINPSLGGIRPIEMINNKRSDKLLMFIKSRLEGYYP
jgi:hypothetical protein